MLKGFSRLLWHITLIELIEDFSLNAWFTFLVLLKSFKMWLTGITHEIQWTSLLNPDPISPGTRARGICSTPHSRGKLLKMYWKTEKINDVARTTSIQSPPGLSHTDSREPRSQVHQMSSKRGVGLQGSGCSGLGLRGAGRLSLDTNWHQAQQPLSSLSLPQLGFSIKSWQGSEPTSMNGFSQSCCRTVCTHHVTGFRQVAPLFQKHFSKHVPTC